jgi:hypothetical protein
MISGTRPSALSTTLPDSSARIKNAYEHVRLVLSVSIKIGEKKKLREREAERTEHSSGGSLPRCGSSRSRVRALAGPNYVRLAGDFSPEGVGRCV